MRGDRETGRERKQQADSGLSRKSEQQQRSETADQEREGGKGPFGVATAGERVREDNNKKRSGRSG